MAYASEPVPCATSNGLGGFPEAAGPHGFERLWAQLSLIFRFGLSGYLPIKGFQCFLYLVVTRCYAKSILVV